MSPPLQNDPSDKAREDNIQTLISEGKKPEQAVAIAYDHQRKVIKGANSPRGKKQVIPKK